MSVNFPNSPEDGDIFSGYIYDATKSVWKKLSDLSSSGIDDLNDVRITSPENGQALIYDTSIEEWINQTLVEPVLTLEGLSDTTIEDPLDGQTLVYDSSLDSWVNETPVEPVLTLEGLSDTTIEDPIDGQALVYDSASGKWINETPASNLSDLSDVTISTATTDQLLRWSGTAWVNDTAKTNSIADSAVTTNKINNLAVTTAKIANANVTTAKIADANVTSAKLGAGTILQVVSTTKTNTFSTTSGSFVDVTGLSATITPRATNSRILVFCTIDVGGTNASRNQFLLVRGSTAISIGDAAGSRVRGTMGAGPGSNDATNVNLQRDSVGINFLDSPSTTSATTYKIQAAGAALHINRSASDSDSSAVGNHRNTSTITLMEVAG